MATYTSNINLKKPAGGDKIRIADINGNMDNIDAAIGAGFGQGTAPSINQAINSLAGGLAIIANGNVHAVIAAGQFVYVRNHGSLAEGLYTANSNISANATLSNSNLTSVSNGGLNDLSYNKSDRIYTSVTVPKNGGTATVTFASLGIANMSRPFFMTIMSSTNNAWRYAGIIFKQSTRTLLYKITSSSELDASVDESGITITNLNAAYDQTVEVRLLY